MIIAGYSINMKLGFHKADKVTIIILSAISHYVFCLSPVQYLLKYLSYDFPFFCGMWAGKLSNDSTDQIFLEITLSVLSSQKKYFHKLTTKLYGIKKPPHYFLICDFHTSWSCMSRLLKRRTYSEQNSMLLCKTPDLCQKINWLQEKNTGLICNKNKL